MSTPSPQSVLDLRIALATVGTITPQELLATAGWSLTRFLIQEGIPETSLSEENGEFWQRKDLARWMRDHPVLKDLYIQGKALRNPSGRTKETDQGYRTGQY